MSHRPFVSIVVCTYKREQILCDTLRALLRQLYPSFEIIVIDQTPRHLPETQKFLDTLVAQGRIRYYRASPSLPKGRNLGAMQARGEVVLFVDDDIIPYPNLIQHHAAVYSEPSIGGVAGRRIVPGEREALEPIGRINGCGRHISNFSSTLPALVEWASGCHMSFRRGLIARAGLFEPKFLGTAAYEDVDFCFRLRRLGYEIRFVPQACLVHLRATSGGCANRPRGLRWQYSAIHNRLLFFMRHYPPRELPRLLVSQVAVAMAYVRTCRNPLVLVPLAGAFIQVFHSYLVATRSLPARHRG